MHTLVNACAYTPNGNSHAHTQTHKHIHFLTHTRSLARIQGYIHKSPLTKNLTTLLHTHSLSLSHIHTHTHTHTHIRTYTTQTTQDHYTLFLQHLSVATSGIYIIAMGCAQQKSTPIYFWYLTDLATPNYFTWGMVTDFV